MERLPKEKLKWIKENIRHGDISKIHELIPEASYQEISAILAGRLVGEHGIMIFNLTVAFLEKRIERERMKLDKLLGQIETL
jgi:hypothetical protein